MKKLQMPIEDELMLELKTHTFKHNITIKDFVTQLIQEGLNKQTTKQLNKHSNTVIQEHTNTSDKVVQQHTTTPIHEQYNTVTHQHSTFYDESKPKYPSPLDPDYTEDPMDERYFYILPKTHHTEKMEEDDLPAYFFADYVDVSSGNMRWLVPKGGLKHFDKDGNLIPFRYTYNGKVVEPTQEQIEKLEQEYEKPVTIEQ